MENIDIKREKLELHAQNIFGKTELERSDRDGINSFSKGVE